MCHTVSRHYTHFMKLHFIKLMLRGDKPSHTHKINLKPDPNDSKNKGCRLLTETGKINNQVYGDMMSFFFFSCVD